MKLRGLGSSAPPPPPQQGVVAEGVSVEINKQAVPSVIGLVILTVVVVSERYHCIVKPKQTHLLRLLDDIY